MPLQELEIFHLDGMLVYVTDPNDLIVEFTVDNPQTDKVAPERKKNARSELNRWLAGGSHVQQHLSVTLQARPASAWRHFAKSGCMASNRASV
jgi:hypothetical protein